VKTYFREKDTYMSEITNPILMFIAIILTIIASFTAFDLLLLVKTARQNKLFLFLGSVFSLATGIWITSFFGLLARNMNVLQSYHLSMVVLSWSVGWVLTAVALYVLHVQQTTKLRIALMSLFMTAAVLAVHLISLRGIQVHINYNVLIFLVSALLTFTTFSLSFWLLFYAKLPYQHIWLKPLSASFVTAAITESHILLMHTVILPENGEQFIMEMNADLLLYLMLVASLIILGSLVVSTTLISKRLSTSDSNLQDIKLALDQSSIVAFTDRKGIITSVNDKFCEISKYSKEELVGQDHRILSSGYHSKEFFQDMWKTIGSGQVWKGEIRNRAKDGTYYWVETTIVPFMNRKGKPYQYLAIRNDITERKKAEEQIRRQDKLAAVGQMAAGIAHEIRNPLTSMKGYAEFLQLDEEDEERREYLSIILDEVERINEIVEDFLVLAKPKAVQLTKQNIIPIIHEVLTLMEMQAEHKGVELHFVCEQTQVIAQCDRTRLKQVLLNLVKNGLEAMPNGGDLYVRVQEAETICISIQDTGIGMTAEQLQHIGDPFFTTKKNGNGLGLMVSFKIIENHHGRITVTSERGKGTTFQIILPLERSK
jgi:PAS domain S-box-containing protein